MVKNTIENQVLTNKVANKLKRKYSRTSKVKDEKLMKQRSIGGKCVVAFFSTLVSILVLCCTIVCVGEFYNSINHTPNLLLGYCTFQIDNDLMSGESISINGSNFESGLSKNEVVTLHSVNTHTLKTGDIIAFYANEKSNFNTSDFVKMEYNLPTTTKLELTSSFLQLLGFHPNEIYTASQSGAKLTLRHIVKAFQDETGTLWFQTQGSNESAVDSWLVNENLVVGACVDLNNQSPITSIVKFFNSVTGLLLLMLFPALVIFVIFFKEDLYKARLNALEQDVIEQKRKLTDPICVQHEVGYRMPPKTKLKVLSQASEDEVSNYISLLWRDGKKPKAMEKYVHKNKLKLYPIKKLCNLNNECEKLFDDGEDINTIADFYSTQKKQIIRQKKSIKPKLKLAKAMIKSTKK